MSLALLVAGCLWGCSFSRSARLSPATGRSDPARIVVLAAQDPGRPYTVVGIVSAQVDGEDPEGLREELCVAAAELGADALLGLEVYWGEGSWNAGLRGSATAVKFQ